MTLTAQATAMRGVPHVSRTEHAVNEARMSARHVCEKGQDAHMSITRDHWFPISPEDTKMVMLSSDMDPKSWKEAMASYDVSDWTEGLREDGLSMGP